MSSTTSQPALAPQIPPEGAPNSIALSPRVESGVIQNAAGVHALGRLSDGDFTEQLAALQKGYERLSLVIKTVLKEGEDILTIPGVKGKVLALPGAEKLDFLARLVATYDVRVTYGEHTERSPAILYISTCNLHLGNADGPVVASSVGTCNSNEPKYLWRQAERECPACGHTGTLFKSKFPAKKGSAWEGKKGWYCYDKKGGCGGEWAPDDPSMTFQNLGRVRNPEPHELDNTLCKMAQKRAHTSATKAAMGGSAHFTVDLEEKGADVGAGAREIESEDVTDEKPAGEQMRGHNEQRDQRPRVAVVRAMYDAAKRAGYDSLETTLKACADTFKHDVKDVDDLTFDELLGMEQKFLAEAM